MHSVSIDSLKANTDTGEAMTHIEVWIYPGCMVSAVTGPLDVLTVANALWATNHKEAHQALFSWSLRSIDGAPVMTPAHIHLHADGAIQSEAQPDVVLLPGFYVGQGSSGVAHTLQTMQALYPLLRQRHQQGCLLASNCSASFVLAEAGLLDDGHATTAWWLERLFRKRYPQVHLHLADVLHEHNNIITSGAASTYLNLAYHLTERFAGQEIAAGVAKTLLIDANRASQMPYMQLIGPTQQEHQSHADPLVQRAQKWLRQHHHRPFRLPALADHLAVSERTVIRHFHQVLGTTPASYAQQIKMDVAKRLLETTTLSLEEVAGRTGYSDPSSFRRLFKRHTGVTPVAYREQFGPVRKSGNPGIRQHSVATTTTTATATTA